MKAFLSRDKIRADDLNREKGNFVPVLANSGQRVYFYSDYIYDNVLHPTKTLFICYFY